MKKTAFLTFIAVGVLVVSCGSDESASTDNSSNQQMVVEKTETYTLDKEASKLKWRGEENDDDFHTGTVGFEHGSMTLTGNRIEGGTLVVDMSTISILDQDMSDEKKSQLKEHLEDEDFFNVAKYAKTTVTLGTFSDGKLNIVLHMIGSKIERSVPLEIGISESEVTMDGNFSIDFSSLGLPGLEPQKESDESISPKIQFALHAVLTK